VDLPNLAIVLVTYARTDLAVRTIRGISEYLVWPKDKRAWFVNDDGSAPEHVNAIRQALLEGGENLQFINTHRFGGGTYNCGHGWNLALGNAHQYADYVLLVEDDWELRNPLDITRYVKMLGEREDVGLVRLGTLAVGNWVQIVGHEGVHYLAYSKDQPYAYSGNPSIRHTRFTGTYGFFAEDRNPGDIEIDYDWRVRHNEGPGIWRPAEINPWGAFHHIGTDKSYE
jgi:hypothetical protein